MGQVTWAHSGRPFPPRHLRAPRRARGASAVRGARGGAERLEGRLLMSAYSFDAAPALIMGSGQNLTSVAAADFNGDGLTDMAVSNPAGGNFGVALSRGNGEFADTV